MVKYMSKSTNNKKPFSFTFEEEVPKTDKKQQSIYKDAVQAFLDTGKSCAKIAWNGIQKHATVVLGLRGAIKTYGLNAKVHDIKTSSGQSIYLEKVEEKKTE
jgi:hypothetical protein